MFNIKHIFKIILVLQILACVLANYGHPDAETIDFGSPSHISRNQMIIEAAIKRGMDGEAVAELLRTKKPVVKTTTTPTGSTKTTTYKLEPDGSISSKSIIEKRNHYVYNSDSIPDELMNSPSGTITRTYTDSNGNKVTQTIAVNRETLTSDKLNDDWFSKPFLTWPREKSSPDVLRRTKTRTSTDTEFPETETHFTIPSRSRTITRTYTKPNGDKHVITTSTNPELNDRTNKPKFPPIGDINWPSFDHSIFSQPWDNPDPDDSDDWAVVENPETTTKKKFESWTPKTWEWPTFPTPPSTTSTTTAKPKLSFEPEPSTLKPLPNLEDFLKSQYGPAANKEASTSTAKTTTTTAKSSTTSTYPSRPATTTPKIIKIEDLPVVEVLHNGKPADKNLLKTMPSHLTPRTPAEPVLNIEHKYPIEEDIEEFTPKVETNIRTYSKTHIGPEKPTLKDLDPQMQDILKKAGIVPEIEGDTITKTRKEPDGRVITTSYKVNTVPLDYASTVQQYVPPQISTHSFNSYRPSVPMTPFTSNLSPISEFLANFGLTKFDIISRNGHFSKTLIDENGDVLTATFVLSSPKQVTAKENPSSKPLK